MRAAILAILTITAPAMAQDLTAMKGPELFANYCASCHGADADGKGPMAPVLLVQPADLTRLAAGNDGVFPVYRVVRRIDGRDPLVSHGSAMPVFGPFFEGRGETLMSENNQMIMTSRPVIELVEWLKTVQE